MIKYHIPPTFYLPIDNVGRRCLGRTEIRSHHFCQHLNCLRAIDTGFIIEVQRAQRQAGHVRLGGALKLEAI